MKLAYLDPNYSDVLKIILPATVNHLSMTRSSASQGQWLVSPSRTDRAKPSR